MEFCAIESCGKCTPCRIGSTRGVEVIDRIIAGQDRDENLDLLDDLCGTMMDASLCGLGGLIPIPVMSALEHFAEDFDRSPAGDRPRRTEEAIRMTLVKELDYGTPARATAETVTRRSTAGA